MISSTNAAFRQAVTTLVPVVPLTLTMISLEQLLERLLNVVF